MPKSLAEESVAATPRSPCSNAWTRADGAIVECGFEHPAGQWCPAELEHAKAGAQAEAERIATVLVTLAPPSIWLEPDSRYLASPDEFDPDVPATWPEGLKAFVRSNCPSKEDIVEAYFACLEERERKLRIAMLKRQLEGVKSAVEQMLCSDCHDDVCNVIDDVIQECPSCTRKARIREHAEAIVLAETLTPEASSTEPVLVDAPEAAKLCGIKNLKTFWKRVERGKILGAYRTGRRVQFHVPIMLASIEQKAKRR